MPGDRRDKANAWDALYALLKREGCIKEQPGPLLVQSLAVDWTDDVVHAVEVLRGSGRLDAKQIWAVKKVVEAAIIAERLHRPLGGPQLGDVTRRDGCATVALVDVGPSLGDSGPVKNPLS